MPYTAQRNGSRWSVYNKLADKTTRIVDSLPSRKTKRECDEDIKNLYKSEALQLSVDGIVDGQIANRLRTIIDYADMDNKDHICLSITSKGGDYIGALDALNTLSTSKKHIVVDIPAYAFSAAAVLALAGTHVTMAENALLMFHKARMSTQEGVTLTSEDLEKRKQKLDACNETLVRSMCGRTGMKEKEALALLDQEKYITAEEALKLGFVDEIVSVTRRNEDVCDITDMQVVNHVRTVEKESAEMSKLIKLCEQLGLSGATEETADAQIVNLVDGLRKKAPEKVAIPKGIVNLVVNSRKLAINGLVDKGVITDAVGNDLVKAFATEEVLNVANVSPDYVVLDSFDSVIGALEKNERVVNYQPGTMHQLPKQQDRKQSSDADILLQDAENRSKK